MASSSDARRHRAITDAVHDEGGKILLQILHAGRYAYHAFSVSASSIKAPINPFRPRALRNVKGTVGDFARCAELARNAGYDGVEIMGSEGYLLNQFVAPRTNKRTNARGVVHRRSGDDSQSRSCVAAAPQWVRTSSSATGCRWPTMWRTARAGTRSSRWQPKSRRQARR